MRSEVGEKLKVRKRGEGFDQNTLYAREKFANNKKNGSHLRENG